MASITLDNLGKVYPGGTRAVGGVNIDIADGEFIVLVGPSGCGKSTLLRMVAGLESISEGEVRIARRPTEAEARDLLFGWLVETGITSNSVIYVKDGATVGIGTGEQDRVGVAEIARD